MVVPDSEISTRQRPGASIRATYHSFGAMTRLVRRMFLVAVAVACLGAASVLGDSSCLSAKSAEECKSQIEEGTGDQCVWCTCRAVPSECLGASLAKVRGSTGYRSYQSLRCPRRDGGSPFGFDLVVHRHQRDTTRPQRCRLCVAMYE